MSAAAQERALELLVDRTTEGISPAHEAELGRLLTELPDLDSESIELAAATIDLAYTVVDEPMPESLKQRVSTMAGDHFATLSSTTVPQPTTSASVVDFPKTAEPESSFDATRWLGWLAAAAILIFAITTRPQLPSELPQPVEPVEPTVVVITPDEARTSLMAQANDLIELAWTATEDMAAQGASGDVVWSTANQQGFMRFSGLAINDPQVEQYQLWIFDGTRDERHPIDGGVFDITADGEIIVPIDPRVPVAEPALFAITVEPPGGVVVSTRERLPLLAKVS